jgi:predicted dehydrogenase
MQPNRIDPVRMAMVGGGAGSFMGPVHRRAAALDGLVRVVAGAFSRSAARNADGAWPGERLYPDAQALIAGEQALPVQERAELVAVLTPNRTHAEVAGAAAAAGFAVLCEKPLAHDLAAARALAAAPLRAPFAVAYTYLGYPMVHEMRALVASGAIGDVRRVAASYIQGWLAEAIEADAPGAAWRTDPAQAGVSGAFGDIGVHAQSLTEFVTGQPVARVMADIGTQVPGRRLDDDGAVLLRLADGTPGTLTASQVCAGEQNGLTLTVYGSKGAVRWAQERPFELVLSDADGRFTTITAAPPLLTCAVARDLLRLPGGHPEGYLEALANIYRALALTIRGVAGETAMPLPSIAMGVRSLAFTQAVVDSSAAGAWRAVDA